MESSGKSFLSPSIIKKPPLFSKDENDQSYQEMQNPNKIITRMATKHFMSPTISAASKANPPRKRILTERNDSNEVRHGTPLQMTSNLDSNGNSVPESCEKEKIALDDDSPSAPYDPLTNYLSPRPKFLRYKPNRRHEILLWRENEVQEGEFVGQEGVFPLSPRPNLSASGSLEFKEGSDGEGEGDLGSRSFGHLGDGFEEENLKQGGENADESDGEFEEVEDERSCCLRGVLKFLLLLVVLMLSTSYISSMNSPTHSPVVKAVVGIKNGYHMVQSNVYGFVKGIEDGSYFLVERDEYPMGFLDIDGTKGQATDEGVNLGEENSNDLNQMVGVKCGETEVSELIEHEGNEAADEYAEGEETKAMKFAENEEKGAEDEFGNDEEKALEVAENEGRGAADEFGEGEETEAMKIVEREKKGPVGENAGFSDFEIVKTENVYDEVAQYPEMDVEEVLAIPFMIHEAGNQDLASTVAGGTSEIENEAVNEPIREANGSLKELIEYIMATGSIFKGVFASMTASLAMAFLFKRNRNGRKVTSFPVAEPHFESLVEKDPLHVSSETTSMSLINSLEKDFNEASSSLRSSDDLKTGAPSVELLSEFVLDLEEMSNSHRRCKIMDSEVSSHSVSPAKQIGSSKAHPLPVHEQPIFSEISMTSPSFGRFANDTRIWTKEEEVEGESRKVVTTPLRRSSRIQSRTVKSP